MDDNLKSAVKFFIVVLTLAIIFAIVAWMLERKVAGEVNVLPTVSLRFETPPLANYSRPTKSGNGLVEPVVKSTIPRTAENFYYNVECDCQKLRSTFKRR